MFIIDFRDKISEKLSPIIGAPPNQLSLILTMFSIIPFCFLNYLVHGKYPRLIYSLVLGLLFQYSIYKFNCIHIFISGIFTYLFIKLLGRKLSAMYVLLLSIAYLSILHVIRLFYYYGRWDIDDPTTIYMMSICKFSSLAFSYEDGEKKEFKNQHHKEYRIIEKPTFLEVLSFIYFYPTSVIGPSIEFKDFINFINESDCYSRLNENLKYIFKNGLQYLLLSFICMAYYAIISNILPIGYFATEDFNHNLIYSLSYIFICVPGIRARYYSGWTLSYSTLVFSGISYTEKKKDDKIEKSLDKGSYGSIIKVEWNTNPKEVINEWNQTIHLWLKYNVYTRIININIKPFKNNKDFCNFVTFIFSAIWHGYYLSYYLSFLLLFCYKNSCDILDKFGVYKKINENKIVVIIVSILNNLSFESIGVIFFNLEWGKSMIGLKNIKYFPCIVIFGLYIITNLISIVDKLTKRNELKDKKDNQNKKNE